MRGHSCLTTSKEPSPLRRQGSSDVAFDCRVIASWLACSGLSTFCRRPSHFSLLAHARAGARANGEAGPKGEGQDARSKESNPKKGPPPESAPSGPLALQVRARVPGFSTGLLPRRKVAGVHASHPCGAFSPPARRLIRGPEDQKRKADGSCSVAAHRIAAGRCARALGHKAKADKKDDPVPWRTLHTGRKA
ncbi:hypothetical protein DYST_00942 [Dyella terrae]|nr:hypothetical protein DYST_00942 [Dyella terrae]